MRYEVSLVLCVILCKLLVISKAQLISNPCTFNEFRCGDGSGCLRAEKLCNGIDDCVNGEDETGNEQWDCSKRTLGSTCRRDQFKCRIGGCINNDQRCDGIPQCWGGSDESIEICKNARPRPRPSEPVSVTSTTTHLPPSTVTSTTTNLPPSTVTTTQTTATTTTTPTLPQPPSQESPSPSKCPPLPELDGTKILCSYDQFPIKCLTKDSPEETIATYSCKTFWSPPLTGSQTTRRVCRNGAWTNLNKNFQCSLNCGVGGLKASGFIVGGVASAIGQWPWHVGLFQQNPPGSGNYEYFCGATLISKRALLTAAHCVTKGDDARTDKIIAVLGKYNRTFNNDDTSVQKITPIEIDIDEYYNSEVYENDIAIVWLEHEAEINERVRPVCLPEGEGNIEPGNQGTLVGWGRWFDRGFPEQLQHVKLPVISVSDCKATHPSLETLSRSTTYCAGYRNGTSACDGDSGGGMVFEEKGRWYIQGVVSAGISVRAGGCDPNYYTVFTKVEKFSRWIHKLLDRKDHVRSLRHALPPKPLISLRKRSHSLNEEDFGFLLTN